jgi:hypothetical protein
VVYSYTLASSDGNELFFEIGIRYFRCRRDDNRARRIIEEVYLRKNLLSLNGVEVSMIQTDHAGNQAQVCSGFLGVICDEIGGARRMVLLLALGADIIFVFCSSCFFFKLL